MTGTQDAEFKITDYLAAGGKLTSPFNVPPRYRAELMRIMATFVDSNLAGAAGFADVINAAPGIKGRIAAARIVLEKTDHAGRVLDLMGEFGANTDRYASHHPWTARLEREADIGLSRAEHDMRLSVFNYPLLGWTDAVVMNLLMGRAVVAQLGEFAQMSYQPLAEAYEAILPVERRHAELAEEGLAILVRDESERAAAIESAAYWWPRVAASFGADSSAKFEKLRALGLRHRSNEALREEWSNTARAILAQWLPEFTPQAAA